MATGLRAILVCVDMSDLLSWTLPYNRHHFDEVMVVTSYADDPTRSVAQCHGAKVFCTNSFYADDAKFNKWRALEEGLDAFGRHDGWLAIMDVDICWPKCIDCDLACFLPDDGPLITTRLENKSYLLTPFRRMMEVLPDPFCIPPESNWSNFRRHSQCREFAGYSQIFHTDCPYLGNPPWHDINYTTAGTADSWFQEKWPDRCKIRPSWECLHIGPAGVNWAGRVTPYLYGGEPVNAQERREFLTNMLMSRRGKTGVDRFSHEKLNPSS